MNNQSHWHQSLEDNNSEQGNHLSSQLSSPRDQHDHHAALNSISQGLEQHNQDVNQQLQPNRTNALQEGSKNTSEEKREAVEAQQQASQVSNGNRYVRVNANGERDIIKVISVNAKLPSHPPPNHQITTHFPPHYPPRVNLVPPPPQHKTSQFKSLDNVRNITQQSFAPSQKTIVLNHASNQANGVYHSHVSTERMAMQPIRQPNIRHSHIHENRMVSPTRVNFDYGQSKQEGLVVRNALFNSYIPTSTPIIVERVGAVSSSNAPQPSERQFDHQDEVAFWREKYQELSRRWEASRSKETKQLEVALGKLGALEKNYQVLQSSYDELVQEYHGKLDENQKYFEQIQQLQSSLNQRQLPSPGKQQQSTRLSQLLKEKDLQLKKLSSRLQQLKSANPNPNPNAELQSAYEQKCMLVSLLKKENEQYSSHYQELEEKYQQELQQMHEHATMLQMEVEQRDAQIRERALLSSSPMRRSDNSQLMLDRSRMESFDNTRVMELEMHIGKLNSELNMREESFERQLKIANLNVAELVDRMKAMTAEKDQTIRNLQEKIGLLESDINRKQSLIRNLRDEVSSKFSPPPTSGSVYSSAVNPMDHRVGEKEDAYKKELQNLRRNLFEREREKMILRQKYEQLEEKVGESEQALGKKKLENQAIRRQLNDFDNLQHENDKLMEVINKKNAEILEMKEMLLEKEQYAGDFQNLSKENDRLRNFMLKKNEELSEMAEKLYNEEKKAREIELNQGPRLHEFQEEIDRLNELLNRKDIEIDKLNQSLSLLEGNYSEIQFQLERKRNIGQEYDEIIRANNQKLMHYQEQLQALREDRQQREEEVSMMRQRMEEANEKLTEKQAAQRKAMQRVEELSRELKMREKQIEQISLQKSELKQFQAKSSKELQVFQSKQGDLQLRCRDLQSLLRSREQRVVRAEKEVEEARQQMKKHQNCAKLIEQMTEKVSNYQMKIISLTMNRGYSKINQYPQPSQVFENRIIYRLKRENEQMRLEIDTLKEDRANPKTKSHELNPKEEGVKNRLNQFSSNLADTISGSSGLKKVRSVQTLVPRESVLVQQNREIQRLKQLAQEMQREELSRSSLKKHITPQFIDMVYQQEIAFYRNKNLELEERVATLLQINKDIKAALEDSLAHKNKELKAYYEAEFKRLERQVALLRAQKSKGADIVKVSQQRVRQYQRKESGAYSSNRE